MASHYRVTQHYKNHVYLYHGETPRQSIAAHKLSSALVIVLQGLRFPNGQNSTIQLALKHHTTIYPGPVLGS